MDTTNGNGHIVLFLPQLFEVRQLENQLLPLQILAVARLLPDKGYRVIPIDGSLRENYMEEILTNCKGALCIGISCIFGYQVYIAATVAKAVKERFPDLPVVLGGWFPTVEPELFLNEGLADIVVRGQGEVTFLELVESLRAKKSYEELLGISFKKGPRIVHNPLRPFVHLDDLPPLPYHLIKDDLEKYITTDNCKKLKRIIRVSDGGSQQDHKMRILWYFSSYGCPNGCNFCCSPGVTKRKWLAKDPVRVVDEIEAVAKEYLYNFLILTDANFCVNENRVKIFCEELIKRGLNLKWAGTAEVHSIINYKKETLELMAKSGCFYLFMGAETVSPETMLLINKNIKLGQTEKSVSDLLKHNINADLSYVVGFPDESPESIDRTIDECFGLKYKYPMLEMNIYPFNPLPGSGFYSRATELGYKKPEFPDGYKKQQRYWQNTVMVHHKKHAIKLNRFRNFSFWAYDIVHDKLKLNFAQKFLNKSALFRIKHKLIFFPIEFWLYRIAARLVRG